ncbi:unnamed protein product [Adineta ricciae]|uniref:Flavin-containing monooxygenase n=1 Tax=Adineta ricciae TaxID=249248 RepID=A0A814JRZ6_ADIRI|nr:unnamed protein product [Adineta ricciae]
MKQTRTVAIIGAGASGLVCAKTLLDDGFDVTLFDQQKELGGIWCEQSAYANLHSQQPGGTFEFSDLFNGEEFAPWQNVHNYLQKYADLFHITDRIHFRTRVLSISKEDLKNESIPWVIKTETENGEERTQEFHLVVVASGLYSHPYLPTYPGQNKFAGLIVPPSAVKSHDQVRNKRVVIVGQGKCATDMAVIAGHHARSCHMVFRKAHWMIPRRIVHNLLPARMLFTRIFATPFVPIPNGSYSKIFRFLHKNYPKLFTTMIEIISHDIMSIHGADLAEDGVFIPQHSFRSQENISIIPTDFLSLKRNGRIIGKLDTIKEIVDATTIRLNSGNHLQADMIILATGFIRSFPFFSPEHVQMLGLSHPADNTELNLYRRVLPVGIPNIAFIGFAGSAGNWMVAEAASHWISEYFLNRLRLPQTEQQMHEEINSNRLFVRSIFHRNEYDYRYYWLAPMEIYLNDMGINLYRTNNWVSEYFGVYSPQRLKEFQPDWELNYLFPSMIFEPAMKLSPPYQAHSYSYSFVVPPPSKLYGPHTAFYLFAGQLESKTAGIVIKQDGQLFQILTSKQYWQSNKVPMPLTMNETTIELYIQDGDKVGPTYTIHVERAAV